MAENPIRRLRVLGVIPARGGSKAIPRKNIALVNGRPLLAYTAEAALASRRLARVVLSTDDNEIAQIGSRWGLEAPFLRAPELARDDTPTLAVLRDVVNRIEAQGDFYDAICLLQPTNPLRRAEDIDGCIELFESFEADTVVSILPVPSEYNPHWVYLQDERGGLRLFTGEKNPIPRRQDLPAAFHREGSVYVTKRDVVMEQNSLYGENVVGYLMNPERCVNVDGPADLERAKVLLRTEADGRTNDSGGGRDDGASQRIAVSAWESSRVRRRH